MIHDLLHLDFIIINDTPTTFKKTKLPSGKTYQLKAHGSSTVPPKVGATSSAAAVPTKLRIASFPCLSSRVSQR